MNRTLDPALTPGPDPAIAPDLAATPAVSVIIPTLNRPALLLAAVRSVLAQTFPSLEVIVVVDGPDTATAAALASLEDPRLRVMVHAENQGAAASRSHGLAVANGDWVAYLDDDDVWMPTKLEQQLAIATNPPTAGQSLAVSRRCATTTTAKFGPAACPLSVNPFPNIYLCAIASSKARA